MNKYVAIFHANLNYAFLIPESYERVIRSSYEVIIDGFDKYPDEKYVFEASGYTIEQMAEITPDVLEKLKAAISRGQCDFMGAPYSHPIMANIPEEDGYWSCEFAQRVYEKHLGMRAESFWNPECTWMQYVPNAFARAGIKYLTLDFESYMTCTDKDYSWTERNRTHDMNWGGHLPWYDLDPNCKFLHRPFKNIVPGLAGFCRSDRLIGKYLSYFRGNTTVEEYVENVKKWSGDGQGATIIIADDAEYCGTTGYYFIKYKGDYSQTFLTDPTAAEKLDALIRGVQKIGSLVGFKEACTEIEPVEEPFFVEDRFAWHRTYADAWANTPEARAWEPLLQANRDEYKEKYQPIVEAEENKEKFKELVEKFWFHMTNSANSDGRWPPPPQVTCEFNRDWCLHEIEEARNVLVELAEAVKGYKLPESEEVVMPAKNDWRYGFRFTDKDPEDIKHLNSYEIQHAIYYAHKMVDSDNAERVQHGKKLLVQIFDELDSRGMKGIRPGSISGGKAHGTVSAKVATNKD
ncbi:Alpha-amylase 1 [Pontiella desulfatans]|uniref:Alpha-amylase 1 n=2 Tax=Pontiella desulfatans TaxID=2750659 RepID=A0A6C2U5I5_PONDE|nr:hypothetical protein [Pontiella desulfatans]VGO15067.1 Alpha-amylase 1 [Pontiella desulfatans]